MYTNPQSVLRLRPIVLITLLLCLLTACQKEKFHIEGTITGAADSVLVFEQMAIDGAVPLAETVLDADGHFRFEGDRQTAPEFYRLRIGGEAINLSIDSCETVSVEAAYPGMAIRYEVSGSDNCLKMRELAIRQVELERRANEIMRSASLGVRAAEDSIEQVVADYKQIVMRDYIFREPMKAYAYFALFQTVRVGDAVVPVFDPQHSTDDIKVFGAVATNWDTYYPQSIRTENLHNITIERMKDVNVLRQRAQEPLIDMQDMEETALIDLALTDNKGQTRALSALKGKVVLLDFHAFNTKESAQRIMFLRELYEKYHARGLEIYQVSLDKDIHLWKTRTAALPWICVHDDGSHTQAYLAVVSSLPADFLIGRDNTVKQGPGELKNLDQAIANAL